MRQVCLGASGWNKNARKIREAEWFLWGLSRGLVMFEYNEISHENILFSLILYKLAIKHLWHLKICVNFSWNNEITS